MILISWLVFGNLRSFSMRIRKGVEEMSEVDLNILRSIQFSALHELNLCLLTPRLKAGTVAAAPSVAKFTTGLVADPHQ